MPLFARNTRSVRLTEAGARFLAGVEPTLTDIETTVEGLKAERGEVTWLSRIDAARAVFEMVLIQILAKLAQKHPRLTVEVRTRHAVRGHRCSPLRCRRQNEVHRPGHAHWVIEVHSCRLEGLPQCQRHVEVDRRFTST